VQRAPAGREEMSGMGAHFAVEQYVGVAKKLQENWARLPSPRSRAMVLVNGANFELAHFDVPVVGCKMTHLDTDNGQFDSADWVLDLNPERFEKATVDDSEAADVARTVYHEARHAEQDFRMARMLAARPMSASAIAEKLDMRDDVAAAAKKQPLKGASHERAEAKRWFESEHGKGADARIAALTDLETITTHLRQAQAEWQAASTPEDFKKADARLQMLKKAHEAALQGHHRLPEEADAIKVGDDVTETFMGKK
jgi:hypothetical protein